MSTGLLGQLSHIDKLEPARFLVGKGECILRALGTRYCHNEITAACLKDGLRKGVSTSQQRSAHTEVSSWGGAQGRGAFSSIVSDTHDCEEEVLMLERVQLASQ